MSDDFAVLQLNLPSPSSLEYGLLPRRDRALSTAVPVMVVGAFKVSPLAVSVLLTWVGRRLRPCITCAAG